MSSLSSKNPTGRFSGLSQLYAQYRPDYPADAIDFVVSKCKLKPGSVLIDIGCGTGISSRPFAERDLQVIGIEPNAEMRATAASEAPNRDNPTYRDGTAETTGLDDGVADAVLAAQAFHWFQPDAALEEFHRILKPQGWVVLMWNERDHTDAFTGAYGAVIRALPDAPGVEVPRVRAGEPLLVSPLFKEAERVVFKHVQILDEEGVLGRAFSASYAPKESAEAEQFARELKEVFLRYQQDGYVGLRYETAVYIARK